MVMHRAGGAQINTLTLSKHPDLKDNSGTALTKWLTGNSQTQDGEEDVSSLGNITPFLNDGSHNEIILFLFTKNKK